MSNQAVPSKVNIALHLLVKELVEGNYEKLQSDGRAGRLSAPEIQRALENYGCSFVEYPDKSLDTCILSFLPIQGAIEQWAVDLALWTAEEGMSDLVLQVTVAASKTDVFIEIDDIRVM